MAILAATSPANTIRQKFTESSWEMLLRIRAGKKPETIENIPNLIFFGGEGFGKETAESLQAMGMIDEDCGLTSLGRTAHFSDVILPDIANRAELPTVQERAAA